jgi:hypothetical protein
MVIYHTPSMLPWHHNHTMWVPPTTIKGARYTTRVSVQVTQVRGQSGRKVGCTTCNGVQGATWTMVYIFGCLVCYFLFSFFNLLIWLFSYVFVYWGIQRHQNSHHHHHPDTLKATSTQRKADYSSSREMWLDTSHRQQGGQVLKAQTTISSLIWLHHDSYYIV